MNLYEMSRRNDEMILALEVEVLKLESERKDIRNQVIRDLIAELEGDRELVYAGSDTNYVINDNVVWWLEEKLDGTH